MPRLIAHFLAARSHTTICLMEQNKTSRRSALLLRDCTKVACRKHVKGYSGSAKAMYVSVRDRRDFIHEVCLFWAPALLNLAQQLFRLELMCCTPTAAIAPSCPPDSTNNGGGWATNMHSNAHHHDRVDQKFGLIKLKKRSIFLSLIIP